MNNKAFWVWFVIVVILGGALVWFGMNATSVPTDDSGDVAGGDVPTDWEAYTYGDGLSGSGFTISHPNAVEVYDQGDGAVVFQSFGPTQSYGTEVYDGLVISFRRGSYSSSEMSFRELIEGFAQQDDEIGEIITPLHEVALGGVPGYAYTFSGQGEFDVYYLDTGRDEFWAVGVLVADPGDLGFAQTSQIMLGSLQVSNGFTELPQGVGEDLLSDILF